MCGKTPGNGKVKGGEGEGSGGRKEETEGEREGRVKGVGI